MIGRDKHEEQGKVKKENPGWGNYPLEKKQGQKNRYEVQREPDRQKTG